MELYVEDLRQFVIQFETNKPEPYQRSLSEQQKNFTLKKNGQKENKMMYEHLIGYKLGKKERRKKTSTMKMKRIKRCAKP